MNKKPGRPKTAKKMIYCRVAHATVEALDRICESMPVKPTRAQLIDAALGEYVERHGRREEGKK